MDLLLKEICEQPQVIKKIIKEQKLFLPLVEKIKKLNINYIVICARGTSDNAAILGKYLFEVINSIPVMLPFPSVMTIYNAKLNFKNTLVIGISQSGEATDVIDVMKKSKKQGGLTVCITNEKDSSITKISDFILYCNAGKEKSLAATKTYTAQLTILYLLSFLLAGKKQLFEELNKVVSEIEKIIINKNLIENIVQRYKYISEIAIIGRGFNFATALESSLKLKEICLLSAQAYSAADFLHGPVAILEQEYPVLVYAHSGESFNSVMRVIDRAKKTKSELIIVSDNNLALQKADVYYKVNFKISELLSPLPYTIFGQLFAYYLGKIKGYDAVSVRYLTKVTKTL